MKKYATEIFSAGELEAPYSPMSSSEDKNVARLKIAMAPCAELGLSRGGDDLSHHVDTRFHHSCGTRFLNVEFLQCGIEMPADGVINTREYEEASVQLMTLALLKLASAVERTASAAREQGLLNADPDAVRIVSLFQEKLKEIASQLDKKKLELEFEGDDFERMVLGSFCDEDEAK